VFFIFNDEHGKRRYKSNKARELSYTMNKSDGRAMQTGGDRWHGAFIS